MLMHPFSTPENTGWGEGGDWEQMRSSKLKLKVMQKLVKINRHKECQSQERSNESDLDV